jgi:sugar phosphate isomerase/epimerase
MKRREFISRSGTAGLGLWAGAALEGAEKRARMCVSSWSLRTLFTATRDQKSPPLAGKALDALDLPEIIADRYQIHDLEIVSPHFASSEAGYCREFQKRLKKARSRLVNVPIDYDELWDQAALSSPDPKEREHAISLYRKWIDNAHALGAQTVRCDPGKVNVADLSPTIGSYKTLVAYAKSKNLRVIVENHGGSVSGHPEELVKILKASGAGALPDIGNFPDQETRERGLRLLFPLAVSVCHVKLNPGRFDLARCVEISKEAGYKGLYSIEAGGRGDPYEGVQQVLDKLDQCL